MVLLTKLFKKYAVIFTAFVLVAAAAFALSGCSSGSAVEFEVENQPVKKGENLKPLRDEILQDVKYAVNIWIKKPEKIEEVFTGSALNDFKAARALDKKEGVKVIRVHTDQQFVIADPNDGKRPQINYTFFDKSYFVDAKTGKPKTKPYNKKRTITIFMVKEGGRYKIESMVGTKEAIR